MEKKINYLARNFEDIKSELINFSNKYYPEITDEEIKRLPAGRAIAMCHTVKVMSDLTKKFQIIEV